MAGKQQDVHRLRFTGARAIALLLITLILLTLQSVARGQQDEARDGITFVKAPGMLYLPLREIGKDLEMPVHWDADTETAYLGDRAISAKTLRYLPDGTALLPVRDLRQWGATVTWNADEDRAEVRRDDRTLLVHRGAKRAVVDLSRQEMRAFQGDRMVMEARISSGRQGRRTRPGSYHAGPYKARMHYSTLYNDAPMPYSVQVYGNIFIHGYSSVPDVPASHGCIRLPLTNGNPAQFFYLWVPVGAPVTIKGRWAG